MENRVTEARVAGARHLGQSLDERSCLTQYESWQVAVVHVGEHLFIADEQSRVEQRNRELDIVRIESAAILDRAGCGADS